mmetsp:Transcript_15596/g.24379  ORF Transcript_15596/g.24379 Transcript_15596/m.24379 type:complete len:126 (-) Transcript_15596:30-407(-)
MEYIVNSFLIFIVVYSVSDPDSFKDAEKFLQKVTQNAALKGDYLLVLVGNKLDEEHHNIPREEGERLAESYGACFFESTSKYKNNHTVLKENVIMADDVFINTLKKAISKEWTIFKGGMCVKRAR